MNKSIIY